MPRFCLPSDRNRIETELLTARGAGGAADTLARSCTGTGDDSRPIFTASASASPIAVPPKPVKEPIVSMEVRTSWWSVVGGAPT